LLDQIQAAGLLHSYYRPGGVRGLALKISGLNASVIRREVMAAAFEMNPYSGIVATGHDRIAVGFFEAWSIADDKLDALLRGKIKDEELEADDFRDIQEKISRLYVGMTVPLLRADGRRTLGSFAKECLLALIYAGTRLFEIMYMQRARANGTLQLFAVAETREGRSLSEDLGFQIDARSGDRKDGKIVYHRDVTKAWIYKLRSDYRLTPDRFQVTETWPTRRYVGRDRHRLSTSGTGRGANR
jgi:hypothetical protein